jgi:hypothetical protein
LKGAEFFWGGDIDQKADWVDLCKDQGKSLLYSRQIGCIFK